MRAVFLDRGTFPKSLDIPRPKLVSEWICYDYTSSEHLKDRLQDADIAVTNKVVLHSPLLSQLPKLKMVQVTATGTNNIDCAYLAQHNIPVQNVVDYARYAVPEHCFSLILALIKKIFAYDSAIKAGKWSTSPHFCLFDQPIGDLYNKKIAIFGKGATGQQVAKIAEAFGMTVLWGERKQVRQARPGYTLFNSALQQADIITLHCPLIADTHHMIDAESFEVMKPSALLINVGRGGLVDETALYKALMQQKIAGAGFDVATQEPMPVTHPFQALTAHPNFILTPHIAWASHLAMTELAQRVATAIDEFILKTQLA